jgi:hypothetical protein
MEADGEDEEVDFWGGNSPRGQPIEYSSDDGNDEEDEEDMEEDMEDDADDTDDIDIFGHR